VSELDLFATAGDALDVSHFGLTDVGTPYVIASVFAKALGYRDAANATRLLDADEKGTQIVSTPGGSQSVSVIYEDGMWELIFRSTLPSAKSLKSRVKAILRQLRETGVVDTRERPMTELEMAERYVVALKRNAELEPKAEAYDRFITSEGDYAIGTVAQMLGTGQNRLFARLRDEMVLISGGKRHNTPYQQYAHHFRVVTRTFSDNDGDEKSSFTTFVKPSGVDFIRKVLKLQQLT
jgi:anti-repressor protein